jgi:glycosyltransferase involved in cell wall biosynthesis
MAIQNLRVAVIEPVGGHGGMDYYDFGLCGGLAAAGLDATLYTSDETAIPPDAGFNVRHSYAGIYDKAPAWRRGLRYLRGTISALWAARREGRRICHFHFFHVGLLQAFNIVLAKLMGRRLVITAHDVESFVESLEVPVLSRWVYRQADRVVAHNKVSRKELIDRIGLPEELITVIQHGNYLHAIRPLPPQAEARKKLDMPEAAKVILFFGQIKKVKGLDLLLEAMPDVLKSHPEAHLLIAGKPWKSDFPEYEAQMVRLGIRDRCITHIHYIHDEDVPNYYAAADVVTLPYRRIYQSGVVLMAMSYGKVVLVSDLPGMTEIVSDGENGLVFRQGDAESLAGKVNESLADATLRDKLARKGFEHMRDHYAWKVIGEKTKKLYEDLSR